MAWELRAAWATGRRVAVSVDGHGRVEGHVSHVAATDAFAVVRGTLVPLGLVLAVHHPSRLGDSTARAGQWEGPAHAPAHHPGQQQFEEWGIDPESGQPTPIEENV